MGGYKVRYAKKVQHQKGKTSAPCACWGRVPKLRWAFSKERMGHHLAPSLASFLAFPFLPNVENVRTEMGEGGRVRCMRSCVGWVGQLLHNLRFSSSQVVLSSFFCFLSSSFRFVWSRGNGKVEILCQVRRSCCPCPSACRPCSFPPCPPSSFVPSFPPSAPVEIDPRTHTLAGLSFFFFITSRLNLNLVVFQRRKEQ